MPAGMAQLTTPAVLVERDRLLSNLRGMADLAQAQSVRLRPHVKTHRSCTIAELQRAHGAQGLTCAKAAEAEVFVNAGFDDIRIAYSPADPAQLRHLAHLARRARVSFCVESVAGVERADEVLASCGGGPLEVLVELDTGYGRAGVPWCGRELGEVAGAAEESRQLRLVGVLTHAGHAYSVEASRANEGAPGSDDALQRIADEERDRTLAAAAQIRQHFESPQPELSIGSTPTMARFRNRTSGGLEVTEIRPGNYVFYDRTQVCIGAARLEQCAAHVLLTVVTARTRDSAHHVLLDGGKKVLTSDLCAAEGYGLLLQGDDAWPGAVIHALSEEHAWVRIQGDAPCPRVGDRVRVLPNHSCVVLSTCNRTYLCDGDRILQSLPVEGRVA